MSDEIEALTESAKAIQAVAKTTSDAISSTASVASFLYRVLGEPVELLSQTYLSDPLKAFRTKRLEELQRKTEATLADAAVTNTRRVPYKIAAPLIEKATLEDDDTLHSMWANLLASAMTVGAPEVEAEMVDALSKITRCDAELIRYIYNGRNWYLYFEESYVTKERKFIRSIIGADGSVDGEIWDAFARGDDLWLVIGIPVEEIDEKVAGASFERLLRARPEGS